MFDRFKRVWRETVDNFWRELEADDPHGRARGVYREMARVRTQLDELDAAIGDTRLRLTRETEQVEACVRRERMARDIGDAETVRVASEYCDRHRERAGVLGRKLNALRDERRLCERDLGEMEAALRDGRFGAAGEELPDHDRDPREHEFRNLEESERRRAAAERLEELKRRMGQ